MPRFVRERWTKLRRWLADPRVIWHQFTPARRSTIEIRQALPLPVCLIVLIWYLVEPSSVALVSLVALVGVVLGDFLWGWWMARGVTAHRRLRFTAMQVGDELEEEIQLENTSSIPVLWAEFVDRSNIPGYTVSSVRGADAASDIRWRAHTLCTRRGVFSLGPWELRIGGPFGLFMVRQLYLQRQEILVYPPMAVLPEQILPHRGLMGDHRPLNQPLRAETIAANSVRAYQSGDPLRRVHWPTTARRADLFVKEFAPEAASNVWLVPDFYHPDHFDDGTESSEETMVTVTASLAAALLEQRLSVGLFACPEEDRVVAPRQGQAHLWSILQTLAPLHAATLHPLEATLARLGTLLTGRDLLVVVTPSRRADWILPLQSLARSRGGSGRVEVILLEAVSANLHAGVFAGLLREGGVPVHVLRSGDLQIISGYYGELNRWEFTVSATGKALLRKTPQAVEGEGVFHSIPVSHRRR